LTTITDSLGLRSVTFKSFWILLRKELGGDVTKAEFRMIENITEEGHIVCYTYKTQSSRKCRTFTPVNITDLFWKEKFITLFYTVQRGFAQGSFKSAKEYWCVTIKMKAIE